MVQGQGMILYGDKDEENRPVLQVAMPRAPGIYAPHGTMHVVARCNNRVTRGRYSDISDVGALRLSG
jgi:hypothetical protein